MAGVGAASSETRILTADGSKFLLRAPEPQDAQTYVDYLRKNWERFRGAVPTPDGRTFAADVYRCRFAKAQHVSTSTSRMTMIFAPDGKQELVGDFTFSGIVHGPLRGCYLGFKIDERFEGRGIMRRALEASFPTIFNDLGLHRIMANYRPENSRSGALLKRLGFQPEGFARDYLHLDGAWRDHILTSLIRPSVV